MARRRRWLWAVGGIALVALLLAVAASIYLRPERLKAIALAEARRTTGLAIEAGPASLRLGFSGVGLRVSGLRVADPDSLELLVVERADAYLKFRPLLRRQVELRRLVLHRPEMRVRSPAVGAISARRAATSPFFAFLAVESWSVEEGVYGQSGPEGDLALTGLELSGGLSWRAGKGASGSARGRAAGGSWKAPALSLALPPLDGVIDFNLSAAFDSLALPRVEVSSGALKLALVGTFRPAGRVWVGSLTGRAEPFTWKEAQGFIPPAGLARLAGLTMAGRFEIPDLRIVRTADEKILVSGLARFSEFSAQAARAPLGLSEAHGELSFAPGLVTVEQGEGRIGPDPIRFSARIEGADPTRAAVSAHVLARLGGATLGGLLPAGTPLAVRGGTLDVDLALAGTPPFTRTRLPGIEGRVAIEDVTGAWAALPLHANGTIRLAGRGAVIDALAVRVGKSDAAISGTLADLAAPDLRFALTSTTLDLDELMPRTKPAAGDSAGAVSKKSPLIAVPGSGSVRIGTLRVRGHAMHDVTAKVRLGLDGLFLDDVKASVYGGAATGSIAVLPVDGGAAFTHRGKLALSGVDLGGALAEWFPIGRRLEGTALADLTWTGRAAPGLDPLRAITLDGVFSVEDGAVLNVSGLAELAQAFNLERAAPGRWPFQRLAAVLAVREGRVRIDTLRVAQTGLGWLLSGSVGLDGSLDLKGLLRADPNRVSLPPDLALFAPYLAEADGRIPIDFRLGGMLAAPNVVLDWEALGKRAAAKARGAEAEKLGRQLQDAVKDPAVLDKLKKIFGWRGGG